MYNAQTINLDMSLRDPTPRVVAKQGDAGSRKIMIKLYDNGIPANINNQIAPSGTEQKGVVRFCKPDGTGGIYDETEDNLPACTLGRDNITVRLAGQMLTCPGDVVADIAIICGNTVISTFNFVVHVQAAPWPVSQRPTTTTTIRHWRTSTRPLMRPRRQLPGL